MKPVKMWAHVVDGKIVRVWPWRIPSTKHITVVRVLVTEVRKKKRKKR